MKAMTTALLPRPIVAMAFAVALSACGAKKEEGRPQGPIEVGFVTVQPAMVPLTETFAGRISAFQIAEVRPQVTGVIQKRLFTEGALVRAGQPLYQIDPSLYRATLNQAQANLASAQAQKVATDELVERYRPLADMEAVSRQDYVNAVAAARQAAAAVGQARAAVETAQVNLRFTTVPAPIDGRIGRSLITVGGLASTNQADPLSVVTQLDPIFVDIQQSAAQLTALRRSLSEGGARPTRADVRLTLEDGGQYPQAGVLEFSEVVVDQATGAVTVRARIPNPEGMLLPGMFVRASFAQAVTTTAYLTPQAAVTRDPRGQASVYVIDEQGRAQRRAVLADRTLGSDWVVTSGLKAGERVITQGLNRVRPNAQVKPVPASSPQTPRPPRREGDGPAPARK